MRFFTINSSPTVDQTFCFLWAVPDALSGMSDMPAFGERVGDAYPQSVEWQMSKEVPGKRLPSLIGTACNYLVVASPLKEVLERSGAAVECLPFTLLDHKKRVASRDYWIVNPLAVFDALDLSRSEITWSQQVPGTVVSLETAVLARAKLASAPALFRIPEDRTVVVLNADVAKALQDLRPPPTNVYLTELEIAA